MHCDKLEVKLMSTNPILEDQILKRQHDFKYPNHIKYLRELFIYSKEWMTVIYLLCWWVIVHVPLHSFFVLADVPVFCCSTFHSFWGLKVWEKLTSFPHNWPNVILLSFSNHIIQISLRYLSNHLDITECLPFAELFIYNYSYFFYSIIAF